MEKQMNEQESLQVIRQMIENSKEKLGESSYFYLLWGWLVFIATLTHFALLFTAFQYPYLMWPIIIVVGIVLSMAKARKLHKRSKVKTYVETAIIHLWIGFTVSLFIIIFSASYGKIGWAMSNSFIILLYGIGTFVSGGILRFKPLKMGGIASWIIAVASMFTPNQYTFVAIALAILVAYLIPGYLLKSKEKLQNHV